MYYKRKVNRRACSACRAEKVKRTKENWIWQCARSIQSNLPYNFCLWFFFASYLYLTRFFFAFKSIYHHERVNFFFFFWSDFFSSFFSAIHFSMCMHLLYPFGYNKNESLYNAFVLHHFYCAVRMGVFFFTFILCAPSKYCIWFCVWEKKTTLMLHFSRRENRKWIHKIPFFFYVSFKFFNALWLFWSSCNWLWNLTLSSSWLWMNDAE